MGRRAVRDFTIGAIRRIQSPRSCRARKGRPSSHTTVPKVDNRMSNREQNRQFAEAIRQIEQKLGRGLSRDEQRMLHDEISGQNLKTLAEIVEWGLALLY